MTSTPTTSRLTCKHCNKTFSHKSSLGRHAKKCAKGWKAPPRRKACQQCIKTKLRCDLKHPDCGRCQAKSLSCDYDATSKGGPVAPDTTNDQYASSLNGSQATEKLGVPYTPSKSSTSTGPNQHFPDGVPPEYAISRERREVLLGTAPGAPSSDVAVQHTMHFAIRVLTSWPRLMAAHQSGQLPPPIHRLQFLHGVPAPLANCYALTKMWAGINEGTQALVRTTLVSEVKRLLDEYENYPEHDLLAALQSLLMLMIMLCFGMGSFGLDSGTSAQLIVKIWEVKRLVSATGLILDEEVGHTQPPWRDWAMVTARRRTVHAFHHFEWAWSLLHGYPVLTCFELGPLPAPPAKHLWQETDEKQWERLYANWLCLWKHGFYRLMDFFHINPSGPLDARTQLWLAEADEEGIMVIAQAGAIGTPQMR